MSSVDYTTKGVVICDDEWGLIKSFMFHGKFETIQLIEYHTCIPYTLGKHNHKGGENTFAYLWDKHPQIFDVFSVKEVRRIIDKYDTKMRKLYR